MSENTTYVATREQIGHSVLKHVFFGALIAYMNVPFAIYYTMSKNHYWHV